MERAQKFVVVQAGTHSGQPTLAAAMNLAIEREAERGYRVERFQVGATSATLLFGLADPPPVDGEQA